MSNQTNISATPRTRSSSSDASSALTHLGLLSENFSKTLADLLANPGIHVPDIAIQAEEHIQWFEGRVNRKAYLMDMAILLKAMLEASTLCGPGSVYYTSCAIVACYNDDERIRESALLDLGKVWMSHFLWPFRAKTRIREGSPGDTTPVDNEFFSNYDEWAGKKAVVDEVFQRDGWKCVISGQVDMDHNPPSGLMPSVSEAAYILKRAISVFDPQGDRNDYLSSLGTLEIVQRYADLPMGFLEEAACSIDQPDNKLVLDAGIHVCFDHYLYTLLATETPNTYKIESARSGHNLPWTYAIFQDHSGPNCGPIALPNPKYFALHAAVGRVLHRSPAEEVIGRILEKFGEEVLPDSEVWTGWHFVP